MNLMIETLDAIKESGHTEADITFIGSESSGHSCTLDEFKVLANRDYDNDFGAQKVATDLVVVFSDGQQLYRSEYDRSEWWEFSPPFVKPTGTKPISNLFTNNVGWDSLAVIHRGEE